MPLPPKLSFIPIFLYSQFFERPASPTQDCTGKTIIVTGANSGLGKEAARHFVRLNATKVIIACRSIERGEAAKADIESSTKRAGVVEVWQLDLSSYDSVKAFAARAQSLSRIDSVVENAGIMPTKYEELEGNESAVTVNVISTFLLALLLLPKLQETSGRFNITPNLTVVSSDVHYATSFTESKAPCVFSALKNEKSSSGAAAATATAFDPFDRYCVTKTMQILACREIAGRRDSRELRVTLNTLTPGLCHSSIMKQEDSLLATAFTAVFTTLLARPTEVGARTLVQAALAGPETHGKFLMDGRVRACAALVEGPGGREMQEKVWAELAAKLDEIEPGVVTKVLGA